jgi:hypothetical protein
MNDGDVSTLGNALPALGMSPKTRGKTAHECALGVGDFYDMSMMTPFAVQNALPWMINF